ncbi:MAG: hypothetical protein V1876_02280, partial [Candidatus Peregrinibacteria bacterium]
MSRAGKNCWSFVMEIHVPSFIPRNALSSMSLSVTVLSNDFKMTLIIGDIVEIEEISGAQYRLLHPDVLNY